MKSWKPVARQEKPNRNMHLRISDDGFELIATAIYLLMLEAGTFVTFRQAVAECCRRVVDPTDEHLLAIISDYNRARYAGHRVLSFGINDEQSAEIMRAKALLAELSATRTTMLDTVALAMIYLLEQKRLEGILVSRALDPNLE